MLLKNSFEGGAPGQEITPENSGGASGDALTDVAPGIVYSDEQAAHGNVSAKYPEGSDAWLSWYGAFSGDGGRWSRAYLRLDPSDGLGEAYIVSNFEDDQYQSYATMIIIVDSEDGSGTGEAVIFLEVWGEEEETVDSGVTSWPIGQWVRIERYANNLTRELGLKIFFDADSATPDVELSGVTAFPASAWRDIYLQAYTDGFTLHVDDVAVSDEGWIGPEGGAEEPEQVNAGDTATLADTGALAATIQVGDTAATAEDASAIALAGAGDTAIMAEAAQLVVETRIEAADGAAVADTAALLAAVSTAEAVALADTPAIAVEAGDTGQLGEHTTTASTLAVADSTALAETAGIALAGLDAGQLGEDAMLAAASAAVDSAALAEHAGTAIRPVTADTAILIEQHDLTSRLSAGDAAQLGEHTHVGHIEGPTAQDAAQLGEHTLLDTGLYAADTAALADQTAVIVLTDRADSATLAEATHLDQTEGPITSDNAQLAEHTHLGVTLSAADEGQLTVASTLTCHAPAGDAATLAETAHLEQIVGPVVGDTATLHDAGASHAAVTASDHGQVAEQSAVHGAAAAADHVVLAEAAKVTVPGIDTPAADTATAVDHAALEAAAALTDQAIAAFLAELTAANTIADGAEFEERALVTVAGMPDDITIRVVPTQRLWRGETVRG